MPERGGINALYCIFMVVYTRVYTHSRACQYILIAPSAAPLCHSPPLYGNRILDSRFPAAILSPHCFNRFIAAVQ